MNSELLAESMSKKFELQAPHLQELTVAASFIPWFINLCYGFVFYYFVMFIIKATTGSNFSGFFLVNLQIILLSM